MSKVLKPIGKIELTKKMILMFLDAVGRPARASEIHKAVSRRYPEAPFGGSLGELNIDGTVRRITMERDALYTVGTR